MSRQFFYLKLEREREREMTYLMVLCHEWTKLLGTKRIFAYASKFQQPVSGIYEWHCLGCRVWMFTEGTSAMVLIGDLLIAIK
jgi:hypothetical protein